MFISTEEKLLLEQCRLLHAHAFISYTHSLLKGKPNVVEDTRDEVCALMLGHLKYPGAYLAPYEFYDKNRLKYIFDGFHDEDLAWRSLNPQNDVDNACQMEKRRREETDE